ncbi:alpha/beta hydrolase [candidate division WWE3 bacterium]|uniref:Alpha/beta hydrolase n=1 Tax=candidate division WWE3 bacterium TaxID=2053526 RepID=A0A955RR79_UNCKA|nr:alpha/beta hydrolase [candidate division WWE3 bacterium]
METGTESIFSHNLPVKEVIVNNTPIRYVQTGNGPSLVLLHGLTNNWYGWGAMIPYLEKDFTLIMPDLPGYGMSGDLEEYSLEIQGEYIVEFINQLPEFPAAVMGVSMGSLLTAEVAKHIGSKLRSVILVSPLIKKGRTTYLTKGMEYIMRALNTTSYTTELLKYVVGTRRMAYALSKHLNMYEFNKELVDEYGIEGKKQMRAKTYPEMSISVSRYDLVHTLKDYPYQTLMIYGKHDRASRPNYAREILEASNPNISCVEIDRGGHWVSVEQPEKVAKQIVKHLAS